MLDKAVNFFSNKYLLAIMGLLFLLGVVRTLRR
jgi:hypothetical protein